MINQMTRIKEHPSYITYVALSRFQVQDGFGSVTSALSDRRSLDMESGGLFNRPYYSSNWQRTSSFDYSLGKDDRGINYYREPPDRRDISVITQEIGKLNL